MRADFIIKQKELGPILEKLFYGIEGAHFRKCEGVCTHFIYH